MKQRTNVTEALALLNQLVTEQGAEFPDAVYQACVSYEVNMWVLTAAYDNQFN